MSQHPKEKSTLKPFARPTIQDLINGNEVFDNVDVQNKVKENENVKLNKTLSLWDIIFFGICNCVGSGVYVISGTVGKNHSGSGIIFSSIISGLLVGVSAYGYIEFSSRIPVIGGSYTYAIASSGELIGFINGFGSIISDPVSSSVSTLGSIYYLKSFLKVLGVQFNDNNTSSYLFGYKFNDYITLNLSAPILSLILCIICLLGIKLSSKLMNMISILNLTLIIIFIIAGMFYIDTNNLFHPCNDHKYDTQGTCSSNVNNSFFPFGFSGIISGSAIFFWSYTGLELIPTLSEECKDPIQIMPKAVFIVWVIITFIYTLLSFVLLGMIPFQSLNVNTPLSNAFEVHNNSVLECIVSFGAFCTMLIMTFATIVGSPRILYRTSIDGLMPKIFQTIHKKFKTPSNCIYLFMIISTICCMFFNLEQAVEWVSVITLFQYNSILIGVLILRYSPPSNYSNINNGLYYYTEQKIFYLSWTFFILCMLLSYCIKYMDKILNVSILLFYMLFCVLILCCFIIIIIFIYFHYNYSWKQWLPTTKSLILTPFCPYLPCITIFINCYIITTFSISLIIQSASFVIFAGCIYFSYGYKHGLVYSNKQDMQEDNINNYQFMVST